MRAGYRFPRPFFWQVLVPSRDALGRPIRWPDASPRRVYKYVDVADAHHLEAGSLKIGSLRSYAELEGARADRGEGNVHFSTPQTRFDVMSDRDRMALALGGGIYLGRNASNVQIGDVRTVITHPDQHCLCLALRPNIPNPDGRPQAVFEVRSVYLLAMRLRELYDFRGSIVGKVSYEGRERGSLFGEEPLLGNPFLKPPEFLWEQEVRITFMPKEPEPLIVKKEADGFVKSLLRRLPDV